MAGRVSGARNSRESVDLTETPLYKGANGGGRNPAAAVLSAAPAPSEIADGHLATAFPKDTCVLRKTSSVDHAVQAAGALMRPRANSTA
jgi:hypothetical protein